MIDVGPIDDFPEGVGTVVRAGGRALVIVKWREKIYALRNVCPHQTQSFAKGRADPRVHSSRIHGEVWIDDDDPVLRCPVHGFAFGLSDGRCVVDPALRVRAYPAELRNDRVMVDIGSRRGGASE